MINYKDANRLQTEIDSVQAQLNLLISEGVEKGMMIVASIQHVSTMKAEYPIIEVTAYVQPKGIEWNDD